MKLATVIVTILFCQNTWAFGHSEKFTDKGMVVVAARHRLSDQHSVTPVDAMEDVRTLILWFCLGAISLSIPTRS